MIDQPHNHQKSRENVKEAAPPASPSSPPIAQSPLPAPSSSPMLRNSQQTIAQKLKSVLPFTRSHSYSAEPLPTEPPSKRGKADNGVPVEYTPPKKPHMVTGTPPATLSPSTSKKCKFSWTDVVHDVHCCMFRITLDANGSTAALCYLPTQARGMVEFYHTEIPTAYRHIGIGDALADQAFAWATQSKSLVIPSCPFIQRYLNRQDRADALRGCVVRDEQEGLERLKSNNDKNIKISSDNDDDNKKAV